MSEERKRVLCPRAQISKMNKTQTQAQTQKQKQKVNKEP
jgi:DUF971 family protein